MLDLKFIRENINVVKKAIKDRGMKLDLDALLKLDKQRRAMLSQVETLKHKRNITSNEIGRLKGKKAKTTAKIKQMKAVSQKIKDIDQKVGEISQKMANLLLLIPNIPDSSLPIGPEFKANKRVRAWGRAPKFDFEARTHLEIGKNLDILDFPRAAKIVGTGFPLYKGKGAQLERALINFMLDLHTKKHNYTEVFPPFLVNRQSMTGTGQLPNLEEDMYRLKDEDYFLVPTAEVPITNMHAREVLEEKDLPIYYTAYSACFRREAGSYGKETKGLVRVHQFNKVELVKFVKPETSNDELESLLSHAEEVLQLLGLPYRVMLLSTQGVSFAAAKCYDLEAWAPGIKAHLEVSSCSNFTDFQARRANIRYRSRDSKKTAYVHTLNGSGIALARTMVAILENYQEKDGSVVIPEVLRPYMQGEERIA